MAGIDEILMPEIDQTLVPGIDQTFVPGIDQTHIPETDQGFSEHEIDEVPHDENAPEDVGDVILQNDDVEETLQSDDVEETPHDNDIDGTLQTSAVDLTTIEVDVNDVDATYQGDGGDAIPSPQLKREREDDLTAEGGEKKWSGWPGESVFRMLVPAQKVGSIIGRKGEFIKKMVEETKARIKILDGPPGTAERAVMVSAKEEPDSPLPPAMDGLLRIHKRLTDGGESDPSHGPSGVGGKVSTRLLLPASQAGSLIGKNGATVKSIQEGSSCIVRVLGAEDLPLFALQDDRVVEVIGESDNVHQAVELIASHLRKFLVDRSVIPLFEMQMQMPPPQMDHHMPPPHQSWGPPQGPPQNSGRGHGFGGDHQQYMPHPGPHQGPHQGPPRQVENYYPPPEMAPPHMDKHPHQGISAYGREAPMGSHASSNAQPAPSMITQITQQMQIPLAYADAVIGSAGANISYIRRASGATVAIQETRGVPNEMTVEISGTASQVQAAQQLIQNFMADAGAPAPQAQTGGPADQGYNQYAAQYGSPPANNTGHAVPGQGQGGGYGPAYGTNYGY